MRIRSIRTRLTLWYTSLLAITFVILGVAAYLLVSYTLHREADSALKSVAVTLAERNAAAELQLYPPDVDEVFRRFFGSLPMRPYFDWIDPRENFKRPMSEANAPPLTEQAKNNALRGIATFETIKGSDRYPVRVLTWPVVKSGTVIGVVRVGMSQVNLHKTMSLFLLIMAALFPFALALAGGGGWFLARHALGPVDTMTQTARRIGAGQLHARLTVSGANDELDRLAETLNEMFARLEVAFMEMRQFTADVSHELQTPLTILRGEIEVALRSMRNPEEYMEVMRSALEEIERISFLVEGLLLLARSDAGVLRMDRKPLDLVLVAEEVLDQLALLAQTKRVGLTLGHIEPLEILADRVHVRRLLFNLVDNAIKYTPNEGSVKISIRRSGDWATLSVEDTGTGIPPEEQQKVFQRFYRSSEARSSARAGSGLGLAIVKSITEAHEGKMEIESAPGRGTTFRVYFPLPPIQG